MCLVVNREIHKSIKNNIFKRLFKGHKKYTTYAELAEEDIHAIKYLFVGFYHDHEVYIAPYQTHFRYELNKTYHIDNWNTQYDHAYETSDTYINEGFHSLVRKNKSFYLWGGSTKCVKVEVIIPKGSYYFIGEHEDIVSDTLIISNILDTCGETYYLNAPNENWAPKKTSLKKKRKRKRKFKIKK